MHKVKFLLNLIISKTKVHSGVALFCPNVYCAGAGEPNVAAPPNTGAWPKPDDFDMSYAVPREKKQKL